MQNEKKLFLEFHRELLGTPAADLAGMMRRFLHEECTWKGPHPIEAADGIESIANRFWTPIKQAFSDLDRKEDILLGGNFEGQGWVAATGHYHGRFDHDWLGIPANSSKVKLRFGEFARIEDGRICELLTLYDLVAFCRQVGINLLPPDRGSMDPVPAPETADGVMLEGQERGNGERSLILVEDMIDGLLEYDGSNLDSMGMQRFWTDNMRWYGPGGIGTTHGLGGFQAQHQGPFLKAFPDRIAAPHAALIAEGNYVSVTGWPSVVGTHAGDYLVAPASMQKVGMRVMDFWRNENGLLAENWVLIDMLDLFMQLGHDLLADQLAKTQ